MNKLRSGKWGNIVQNGYFVFTFKVIYYIACEKTDSSEKGVTQYILVQIEVAGDSKLCYLVMALLLLLKTKNQVQQVNTTPTQTILTPTELVHLSRIMISTHVLFPSFYKPCVKKNKISYHMHREQGPVTDSNQQKNIQSS